MTKKTFTTETTAAAELFKAPAPAPAPTPARAAAPKAPAKEKPTTATAPLFTWKARPDGEKRDRRLQIICKNSVAQKAAEIARARGIFVAFLFEKLILEEWEREHGRD